jgi:hypothetical protein
MLMMLVCSIFLVAPCCFALPVRVPRGSYLPSGSFGYIRGMMSLRAARYTERGRDRIAMKSNLLRVHLCAREVIWCSIFPLDNLSYVIVMVRELS